MKKILYALMFISLLSCKSDKIPILKNGYLGMTTSEYAKVFTNQYALKTSSSKFIGALEPGFKDGQLHSLAVSIRDISDFDTAYTVFELGNDLIHEYGTPIESRESIWAGGTSKHFKWKSGALEVAYNYNYNQVPGTSGLLYTGDATVSYSNFR